MSAYNKSIPSIEAREGESRKEDGAQSQTCHQQGGEQDQLSHTRCLIHAAKLRIFVN